MGTGCDLGDFKASLRLTASHLRGKLLVMPGLPDARHERFAQLVADKRTSNAEAYRIAIGKPEMAPKVAASMADKWLKRVDISDRIAELKASLRRLPL